MKELDSTTFRETYGPWAVITGASSGLGAEFARQLASHGLHVVVVARRKALLDTLCGTISQATQGASQTLSIEADLGTEAGIEAVIEACTDLEVGLLVNNAAVALSGSFFADSAEEISQLVNVNVRAVTRLSHSFGRSLCRRRRGGILMVSSLASTGLPWMASYSSSKSFVSALGSTLQDELGRYNVHCLTVEPGFVRTDMTVGEHGNARMFGRWMMEVETCVSLSLRVMGRGGLYIPDWTYVVMRRLMLLLPTAWSVWLVAEVLLRVVGPFPIDSQRTLFSAAKHARPPMKSVTHRNVRIQ